MIMGKTPGHLEVGYFKYNRYGFLLEHFFEHQFKRMNKG